MGPCNFLDSGKRRFYHIRYRIFKAIGSLYDENSSEDQKNIQVKKLFFKKSFQTVDKVLSKRALFFCKERENHRKKGQNMV